MPHTHHKVLWNSCLQKIVSHGDFWKHFCYCLALNSCPYFCFSPVLDLRHLHKLLPGSGRKEGKILKMAAVQMIYVLWIATRQARAQVLIFLLVSQLPLSLSAFSSSERWHRLLLSAAQQPTFFGDISQHIAVEKLLFWLKITAGSCYLTTHFSSVQYEVWDQSLLCTKVDFVWLCAFFFFSVVKVEVGMF